ncbi:hypothetical protein Bca52824_024308 [Brassica carinata]|uniref:Uncharacterized protein n=1 Tax=Brassica carinata TaxID=52824 RepID=A0A8X7VK19_BRACI|nr:hypothetical protein Bca52824_024308 [Brassica carinata]
MPRTGHPVRKIDDGLSPGGAQMDPAEEMRDRKRQMEHSEMLHFVADSEYGIPRSCACGGRMIDEVRCKEEYDYLPVKRFFTWSNVILMVVGVVTKADGLHYRQPWVAGVQEEIQRLKMRVEDAEQVIKGVPNLINQIERLQEQVYNLTAWVTWRSSASTENQR